MASINLKLGHTFVYIYSFYRFFGGGKCLIFIYNCKQNCICIYIICTCTNNQHMCSSFVGHKEKEIDVYDYYTT
jgi:hypothetical protein